MRYNNDAVTLQDCIDMYEKKGYTAILNDGKLVGFERNEE